MHARRGEDAVVPRVGPGPRRRVVVTGDTGFIGSWLVESLLARGAAVHGFALTAPPAHSVGAALLGQGRYRSMRGDVRDLAALASCLRAVEPELVVHLAAQSSPRAARRDPIATFAVNATGTANLLEAARALPSLRAIVVVTSAAVYADGEIGRALVESDALGADEPYGASKAAAEMALAAWRTQHFAPRGIGVASARMGNIIGGGDWGEDRIVPDAVRAFLAARPLVLRDPHVVRPWLHVLDAVAAIIGLAEALLVDPSRPARAWNFGPSSDERSTSSTLAALACRHWGASATWQASADGVASEARPPRLDSSAARCELGWQPRWTTAMSLERTIAWYRAVLSGADALRLAAREREDAAFGRSSLAILAPAQGAAA
jgi:CDP-glucose 4,6-dehydratase